MLATLTTIQLTNQTQDADDHTISNNIIIMGTPSPGLFPVPLLQDRPQVLCNQEVVGPCPTFAPTNQVQAANNLVRRDAWARLLPGGVTARSGVNIDVWRLFHDLHEATAQTLAVDVPSPSAESQQVARKLGR